MGNRIGVEVALAALRRGQRRKAAAVEPAQCLIFPNPTDFRALIDKLPRPGECLRSQLATGERVMMFHTAAFRHRRAALQCRQARICRIETPTAHQREKEGHRKKHSLSRTHRFHPPGLIDGRNRHAPAADVVFLG